MKTLKMVLSLAAVVLSVGAIVCATVAFWDNLAELCACAKERLTKRGSACCDYADDDGFSDFVDVE
ncbi:MAG: hypothetical protein ACOX0U_07920 [Oscillospiraceae bacterium]